MDIKVLDDKNLVKFSNFFDYIRLEQVLEHVDDLNLTVKTLSKIIKRRNIIYWCSEWKRGINNNIIVKKGPIQPLEHLNCFNRKSLSLLAKKYGFR